MIYSKILRPTDEVFQFVNFDGKQKVNFRCSGVVSSSPAWGKEYLQAIELAIGMVNYVYRMDSEMRLLSQEEREFCSEKVSTSVYYKFLKDFDSYCSYLLNYDDVCDYIVDVTYKELKNMN